MLHEMQTHQPLLHWPAGIIMLQTCHDGLVSSCLPPPPYHDGQERSAIMWKKWVMGGSLLPISLLAMAFPGHFQDHSSLERGSMKAIDAVMLKAIRSSGLKSFKYIWMRSCHVYEMLLRHTKKPWPTKDVTSLFKA